MQIFDLEASILGKEQIKSEKLKYIVFKMMASALGINKAEMAR